MNAVIILDGPTGYASPFNFEKRSWIQPTIIQVGTGSFDRILKYQERGIKLYCNTQLLMGSNGHIPLSVVELPVRCINWH